MPENSQGEQAIFLRGCGGCFWTFCISRSSGKNTLSE